MAKLIHALALEDIKKNTLLWVNSAYTTLTKAGIVFTDDGYMVGRGTEYQLPLASNTEGTESGNRRLWAENGVLKLIDSARFEYTSGPHIDYVSTYSLSADSTVYLTGTSAIGSLQGLSATSTIKVVTDSSGNAQLVTPALDISSGINSLTFNGTKLLDFITEKIQEGIVTTDAMVFAGTVQVTNGELVIVSNNSSLDFGVSITNGTTKFSAIKNYSAGWTWKVVTTGGAITNLGTVEIGDIVMAVNSCGTAFSIQDFTVIQANIDGAVTASINLTDNGLVLGNGSKSVKTLITTNSAGYLKPNGANAPTWESFGTLTLDGTIDFQFNPTTDNILKLGLDLDITSTGADSSLVYTLSHSNTIEEQGTAYLKKLKFDSHGHIVGVGDVSPLTFAAVSASGASVNGTGIENLTYDGNVEKTLTLKAGTNITLTQNTSGVIQISAGYVNTWRPIYAWNIDGMQNASDTIDEMLGSSVDTYSVAFGPTFGYSIVDRVSGTSTVRVAELDLIWAEVAADGTITYN